MDANDIKKTLEVIQRESILILGRTIDINEVIEYFSKNENMYWLDKYLKSKI